MLEFINELMYCKVSLGSKYTQFTFVVKLLYTKSFHHISNVAFNAIMNVLSLIFPDARARKMLTSNTTFVAKKLSSLIYNIPG
jgi:hypothetical protein